MAWTWIGDHTHARVLVVAMQAAVFDVNAYFVVGSQSKGPENICIFFLYKRTATCEKSHAGSDHASACSPR